MYKRELETALKIIKIASDKVMEIYNSDNFDIEIKSDNSPVTKADKVSDELIRNFLNKEFPTYAILTEESEDDLSRLNNDYVWIVDPVDGTKDFIAKNNEFTINIGLAYKHEAVLGVIIVPSTGEIFYASKNNGAFYLNNGVSTRIFANQKLKDLRVLCSNFHFNETEQDAINRHKDVIKTQDRVGSTIKGCLIAKGEAEISYRFSNNTKEWDTCAMQVILEESGAHLLKFDGTPIRYNREDVYNRGGYIMINRKENFLI